MKACVLAALPLVAALAATPSAAGDSFPTGHWYTEGVENGLRLQSVVQNSPDGTFTKNIRNGTDCSAISTWVETGTWTYDGKQYVEVTQTVNGQKVDSSRADYNDAFEVTRVDDSHVTLHDVKTLLTWSFSKVDQHFAMSPPKECTV